MFYFKCPLLLPEYIILTIVFLQIEEGIQVVYKYLSIIEFDYEYRQVFHFFFLRHSLVPVIVDQQEYSVCVLGMSLMCLQCNDAIQPRHCHTITYCAEDEVRHLLTGNTLRTITKNILTMFSLLDCRNIANTCISLRKRIKSLYPI